MDNPFRTRGLRHAGGDPRGLLDRIEAQLGARIEEAVEMAALHLLVELRRRGGAPLPQDGNPADRAEFEALSGDLLSWLCRTLAAGSSGEKRQAPGDFGRAAADARARALREQVFLARTLPDYWQRFEGRRAAFEEARLASPAAPRGLFKRLFGR